jgi:hypothetical protein
MKKKFENPLFIVAQQYAGELDFSKVAMVDQAVKFYKTLHSKTAWLERFHQECEPINQFHFDGKTNCVFFDSVLTAEIFHRLELQLGAAKSSLDIAVQEIEAMQNEIDSGKYERIFGVYPQKAYTKFLERLSGLQYPWLELEENLLIIFMVAHHKMNWELPEMDTPLTAE